MSVHFNRHSPLFTVKLLTETIPKKPSEDEPYEYESAVTNEESEIEAASLAFQIEHEIERQ